MIRASNDTLLNDPRFVIEEVTDPARIARHKAQRDQFSRNSDWLASHWATLLPQARGKFVAVAAQEAIIADTAEEAWAWAAAQHPEDAGALVRYVIPGEGPRIYANTRHLVALR
jgi:hypothetical protein